MVPKLKRNLLPFLPYLSNYKNRSILWPTILLCLSVPLTREESSPKVPFKTLLVRCCLIDSQPDFQGRFVTSSSILIFKMPMKVPKAALLAGRAGVSFSISKFLFCKYFSSKFLHVWLLYYSLLLTNSLLNTFACVRKRNGAQRKVRQVLTRRRRLMGFLRGFLASTHGSKPKPWSGRTKKAEVENKAQCMMR